MGSSYTPPVNLSSPPPIGDVTPDTIAGSTLTIGTGGSIAILVSPAANTLAQRSGANAQTLLIERTYTDDSNFERGIFRHAGGEFQILTQTSGSGVAFPITIGSLGSTVRFYAAGGYRWEISTAGHFIALAAYNITTTGKTTTGTLNISAIPTSAAGLSSGDVWNNLGILTIVS